MPDDRDRRALKSSDAERAAASAITAEDLARALAQTPLPAKPYVAAKPGDDTADGARA